MLEGSFTNKVIRKLRTHPALEKAVVIKHINPFHRGVPDFSVTIGPRTFWVEVKLQGRKPEKIQYWHLRRMDGATLWFNKPGSLGLLWHRCKLTAWLERDTELIEEIVRCVNA
jgi:hypothetical protein